MAELDANATEETETSEDEQAETFSPLDPEVEAPINAAVHFEDPKDAEVTVAEKVRPTPTSPVSNRERPLSDE